MGGAVQAQELVLDPAQVQLVQDLVPGQPQLRDRVLVRTHPVQGPKLARKLGPGQGLDQEGATEEARARATVGDIAGEVAPDVGQATGKGTDMDLGEEVDMESESVRP